MKKAIYFVFLFAQLSFCQVWQDKDDSELDKMTPPRDSKEYYVGSIMSVLLSIGVMYLIFKSNSRKK
jgi:hypothetical protein